MAKRSKSRKSSPTPDRKGGLDGTVVIQALLIVMAGLWVYWPALHGRWLWDDDLYFAHNPLLKDPDRLWKAWFMPGSFIEYYPIEETVQWVQWQFWGNNTFGYHLTNVLLHLTSSLLVWRLLGKLGLRLAWVGGLIFAIHPVQVESVAWIAELKNTLSLPPFLLAMCAYIDFDEHRRDRDYFWAVGWFLIAMLCKISMALFPVTILLYAWWKRDRIGWSDLKAALPFLVISVVLGAMTIWSGDVLREARHETISAIPLGGVFSRMALVGLSISFYFSKCFWPVGLLPIYPMWKVDPPTRLQFLPWLAWGGVICWLWAQRQTWSRTALLGLGFFLINLAPFAGFIAASYMGFTWVMDHFLYIPIIGLIGLVVAAMEPFYEKLTTTSLRPVGLGALTLVTTLMAFESHAYAGIFVNQVVFWTYTMQHNPDAPKVRDYLGYALLESGRYPEAGDQFKEALRLDPNDAESHYDLAVALDKMGQVNDAIAHYQLSLQINPGYAIVHNNLGNALFEAGRIQEALEQYRQVAKLNPQDAMAYNNMGITLAKLGRLPEAMENFQQAVKISPNNAMAHNNMGNALLQSGRNSEARQEYEEALRIDPDYASARNNLERLQAQPKSPPKGN